MCFNWQVSLLSFIIGTILNIYLYRLTDNINVKIISLFWQFTLFMQFFDFLSWTSNCPSKQQEFSTKMSYIFTVFQPIIIYFLVISLNSENIPYNTKLLSTIIVFIYLSVFLIRGFFKDTIAKSCVKNLESCSHIDYYWWNDKILQFFYFITSILIVLMLIKPFKFSLSQLAYVTITFFITVILYNCGIPSIWCFFQVFAPIFTILTLRYLK